MNNQTNRREFLKALGIGSTAFALGNFNFCTDVQAEKPNFVFFLIDDLGWKDLGCYGSTFYETPNIDKLAAEGMKFTDAYAACPVCSPTRASILSGKYPARLNITNWIGGRQKRKLLPPEYVHQLPLEEITMAEVLKETGYATGFIGKWHLGEKPYFPENQGFDVNIGGHGAGHPASYFYPYKSKNERRPQWNVPGLDGGKEGEYLTDRLTDESLKFLDNNKDKPFLLYLSHYAVHTPVQSKKELTDKYREKVSNLPDSGGKEQLKERLSYTKLIQDNPAYAGMVQSTDESIGRVMNKLDELGLSENTIVIFMSDNGGLSTISKRDGYPTANLPLRAGKGWLYEGGIREPMIIKWPGVVKPGSVCNDVVTSTDFYPTMLEMAGRKQMPEQHVDGISMVPLLKQEGTVNRDAVYWHFPHYHGSGNRPSGAVRAGDYKLIEWYEDSRVELYNLKEDIGELNDLSQQIPEKVEELKRKLDKWRKETNAKMPVPNPDWKGTDDWE